MVQKFGAGIWHFYTYVTWYNTEGYGEPRSVLDAINLAGQVNDLSFVDINYPYFGGSFSNQQIKDELDKVNLEVIGITPEIYTKEFRKGAFTNPDPGIRNKAHELITEACEAVRFFNAAYVKLWPGQDGWDYPFQVDRGTLWKVSGWSSKITRKSRSEICNWIKPREPRVNELWSVSRTLLE